MKKLFFLANFILSLSVLSMARTERGAKLIGGTGTLHIGTGGNEGTLLLLSPRAGFFVANNLAVGATLPLSLYAYGGSTTTSIGLSPFARGYFGASPATRFLLEGRIGFHRYGYNSDSGGFNDNTNTFIYGIGVGLTHFISDQVGLEVLLSYDNAGDNDAIFNFSNLTGINLNVGFQIYLPTGK